MGIRRSALKMYSGYSEQETARAPRRGALARAQTRTEVLQVYIAYAIASLGPLLLVLSGPPEPGSRGCGVPGQRRRHVSRRSRSVRGEPRQWRH